MHKPRDLRLTHSQRLGKPREFRDVFAQGARLSVGPYVVMYRCNHGQGSRLGLAVSRRGARRAVDRNKLKRIARESFRLHASMLPAMDIVVISTPKAAALPNENLFASLIRAWKLIGATECVAS